MGRYSNNGGATPQGDGMMTEASASAIDPSDGDLAANGAGKADTPDMGTGTGNEGRTDGNNGDTTPDSGSETGNSGTVPDSGAAPQGKVKVKKNLLENGRKRVCNPGKKGKKLIVGKKLVEFDADGSAELDDADAAYLLQIPGYKVL
jgi:hypothetical protein